MTELDPSDLADKWIESAAALLVDVDVDAAATGDVVAVARRLAALRRALTAARLIEQALTDALADNMDGDRMTVPGVGAIERAVKLSTTWIDDTSRERLLDDLRSTITGSVARDRRTGEIDPGLRSVADDAIRALYRACSISPKSPSTMRREVGIDLDEYQARRRSGWRVVIDEETSNDVA